MGAEPEIDVNGIDVKRLTADGLADRWGSRPAPPVVDHAGELLPGWSLSSRKTTLAFHATAGLIEPILGAPVDLRCPASATCSSARLIHG